MRKALFVFGLLWVVLFCLLGVYLGFRFSGYAAEVQAALKGQDLARFFALQTSWKHKTSAHAHALCLSFLTLFLALLMPHMALSGKAKVALGVLLIVGVVLASVFGWLFVPPAMATGEILVILAAILGLAGLLRGRIEG